MKNCSIILILFCFTCLLVSSCNYAESKESNVKFPDDKSLEHAVTDQDEIAVSRDTIVTEPEEIVKPDTIEAPATEAQKPKLADKEETKASNKPKVRPKPKKYAQIRFMRDRYNFGNIVEGDTLRFKFDFINDGNLPLNIENVEMSCGCTSLDYPEEPIEPGEYGKVEILYNSLGKIGRQAPNVTLITNSRKNRYSILQLEGVVYPKEDEETNENKKN